MDWLLQDYGWYAGQITAIDVNGGKGPNTWGRDVFQFYILPNGHLAPQDGVEYFRYLYHTYQKDTTKDPVARSQELIETRCATDKSKADSSNDGIGCAARIIDNGWVMDY
jgi:hypothetical protein